jgi:hypothetical protein
MTDLDTDAIDRRMKLSIGIAVLVPLAYTFALFLWMKSVENRIHALNKRVETLEAMHGYAIDGATHDKHN